MQRIDSRNVSGAGTRRVHSPMLAGDSMDNSQDPSEVVAVKRARRLLRICDIAATKTGRERDAYLRRACFDEPDLLAEALAILDAVEMTDRFLLDFDLFPSLPPGKSK